MRCLRVRLFSSTVLLWLGMSCATAYAQAPPEEPYAMGMEGVPLQQALKEFARLARIDLVYSSELVAGRQTACTTALRAPGVEDGLRCLLAGTGLGFIHSTSGAYVLWAEAPPEPRRGSLSGTVEDGETGSRLSHADVVLAGAARGTSTDTAGVFRFSGVPAGLHRIVVSYVGYAPVADSVWIAAGNQQHVHVALQAVPQVLAPIVVDGQAERPPTRAPGVGVVELNSLATLTGTGGLDVLRLAGHLAGVTAPEPLADLHIQGGASGEHLLLLDGVPVRNPVSLGRYYGAFSPLALKRLTVHKAGFEAAYGSYLAGTVALEHDVDGQDGSAVALSLDPVSLNGRAQGRWNSASGQRLVAMAALRTSIWSLYQDAGTQELISNSRAGAPAVAYPWLTSGGTEAPSWWQHHGPGSAFLPIRDEEPLIAFSDFHAAARLILSPSQVAYGSLYHGSSYLAIEQGAEGGEGAGWEHAGHLQEAHQWRNWAGQLRYSWAIGDRSAATVHVQESRHDARYAWQAHTNEHGPEGEGVDGEPEGFRHIRQAPYAGEHNLLDAFTLLAELSRDLSPRGHVQAGLALDRTASDFQLGNRFIAPFTYRAAVWDVAGYVQGTFGLSASFTLEPSLRLTWLSPRRRLYAEPRIALHYDRPWRTGGTVGLRLAGGVYRQFTNQFELSSAEATSLVPSMLFWLPAAPDLAPPRAYHATAEAVLAPDAHWSFNAEGYYKAQPRLLLLDYARLVTNPSDDAPAMLLPRSLAQHDFLAASRGRAYGGSLQVCWSGTPVSSALTYSFSQALRQYPGRFEGRMLAVPWNEPHRLALRAQAPLPGRLALDLDWTGSWGRRWELNQVYYDYLASEATSTVSTVLDLAHPDVHRLPAYYQLDLGLSFEQIWRAGTMHFQVGVRNVLDRHNVYDQILLATGAGTLEARERLMPGRHVVFSVLLNR